ncbi:unnamed protein product [Orchesella dallaii]|uniref:Uncharacterized protein n=1 Tax=Orchesella dallaii TaxID=48710 RepID=A0ABP1QJI9_9HEXA
MDGSSSNRQEKKEKGGPRWWHSNKVKSSDSVEVQKKTADVGLVPCIGSESETGGGGEGMREDGGREEERASSPQGSSEAQSRGSFGSRFRFPPSSGWEKKEDEKSQTGSKKDESGEKARKSRFGFLNARKGGAKEEGKKKDN